ncbi:Peptidoglycan-synthase activator LpoB [Syntrophus gentianae]|uniref:Peptidoglycan-synthase activator LpoB n=1 Tax=Syntrophus gentianae TaxID=43775 RepID=A0A1H7U8P0_9BACT|nr:hypothetical protein [Syntrophus gentianae]SEL93199.1 Peptidoglycan-synthase activator LpoB [Syntrophus gentianae]
MKTLSNLFQTRSLVAGCLLILFASLSFLLFGCAPNNLLTETYAKDKPVKVHRIAVFPIQRVDPDEAVDGSLRCEICGTVISVGSTEPQAEKVVEEAVLSRIEKTGKYEIVPPERVQGVYQRISATSLKSSLKDTLVKSGRELGADAILHGQVYRFRERIGYAYGADKAASVAFALHLIDVRDGSLIWKGRFDKTQTSLMENVFQASAFYKEKGRWLTARELIDEGVSGMLETFPGAQ